MAEVHLIGQILGSSGFSDSSAFLKWRLQTNSNWSVLEGIREGQTHLTKSYRERKHSNDNEDHEISSNKYIWSHPIDIHYVTKGLQGWPKFEFQVWGADWLGKCNISAYGFLNVPMQPGYHELTCYTWRPVGDIRQRFVNYITGYRMHLLDPSDPVTNGLQRHAIQAQSMGTISVQLTVVLKGFEKLGFDI